MFDDTVPIDRHALSRIVEVGDLLSEENRDLKASRTRLLDQNSKLRRALDTAELQIARFERDLYHTPCPN